MHSVTMIHITTKHNTPPHTHPHPTHPQTPHFSGTHTPLTTLNSQPPSLPNPITHITCDQKTTLKQKIK